MTLKEMLNQKMTKKLIKRIENMHSFDIAKEFHDLTDDEKKLLYLNISTEKLADILSYLDTLEAADFLQKFELDVQSKIIDEMTTDDAVDVLQEYDDEEREKVVETLELVDNIKEYLKYEDNETGAYMTSEYVILNDQLDVKQGVKGLIKQAPEAESINHLYLVDNEGIYSGTISLKALVKARSPKPVKDLIEPFPTLLDTSDIEKSVRDLKNYNLLTMPVLNANNELVGILTIDDALDIIAEEAREDYAKMASVREIDSEANVFKTAWHRLPWLIILLVLGIPVALLTGSIGGVVASISLLILFEPLLLDTPGNVATQTLAVNLQTIYKTGKINPQTVFKETISGLYSGLILGAASFIISYIIMTIKNPSVPDAFNVLSIIQIKLIFSGILSLSIIVSVLIAPLIASFVPWILTKLKVDPAVSSGSFIITLIDIIAVSIYFLIANGLISLAGGDVMILDLKKSNYALKKELVNVQPFDIAVDFDTYSLKDKRKIASLIGQNKMVKVFIELPVEAQIDYFNQLSIKEQKNFINLLPTDELNHFIKYNQTEDKPRLVNYLPKQKASLIDKLLSYDEEEVASIMSTEYIELKPNMTCGEATSYVFNIVKDSDFINLLYVVDKDKLIGIVSLKDLIIARKNQSLNDIILKDYYFAFDDDSIKSAIEKVKSYDISALPVLSHDLDMLGIITVDDVIEEMHDDIVDAYQKLGFLKDHEDSYSPFNRTLARLPWLLIVLLLNTVFLSVLQVFEQTLTTISVLLLFQPLVLNMSGNIGAQSMAVTILVLTEKSQNIKQTIKKETLVGLLNSTIIGVLGFLMSLGILMLFFKDNGLAYSAKFGIVVALSLFSSMFMAALSGAVLPIIFYKLGYDVKNASGPILTTINDIVGLTIYFLVATLLIL